MRELRRLERSKEENEKIDKKKIEKMEKDMEGRLRKGMLFEDEGNIDKRRKLIEIEERMRKKGVVFNIGVEEKEI